MTIGAGDVAGVLARNAKAEKDATRPRRKRGVKVGLGPGGKYRSELDAGRVQELMETQDREP